MEPKDKNMKNKAFIIVAGCLILASSINFTSENQSWYDYFRSKWSQLTGSRTAQRAVKPLAAASLAYTTQTIGPGLMIGTGQTLGLTNWQAESPWSYRFGYLPIAFIWLTATIAAIKFYREPISKINKIKEALTIVLSNPLLYPTRSSKLHALLKKDEFLGYIEDKDGLVQEACNELIDEINKAKCTDAQKKADAAIDKQMSEIRNMLKQYVTLDEQINALETQQYTTNIPAGMQAYLSLYFRLKNKQAVENKLSSKEKASRQSWAQDAEKVRVSEPTVD